MGDAVDDTKMADPACSAVTPPQQVVTEVVAADAVALTALVHKAVLQSEAGEHLEPFVVRGAARSWAALKEWVDVDAVCGVFGSVTSKFRCHRHTVEGPVWESQCTHVHATFQQFNEWRTGDKVLAEDHPFHALQPRAEWWAYADYQHVQHLFKTPQAAAALTAAVDWAAAGLDFAQLPHSTFWMGTQGSYTPCHYDTYGVNFVVQVVGTKSWRLYSPTVRDCMYPTRIPFEESSVFSTVHVQKPDWRKHPNFWDANPFCVDLTPGDLLFVPNGWWHFVQSTTDSVSINHWTNLAGIDDDTRVMEAVARNLISSAAPLTAAPHKPPAWMVNPTDELWSSEENLAALCASVARVLETDSDVDIDATNPAYKEAVLKAYAEAITHPYIVQLIATRILQSVAALK